MRQDARIQRVVKPVVDRVEDLTDVIAQLCEAAGIDWGQAGSQDAEDFLPLIETMLHEGI